MDTARFEEISAQYTGSTWPSPGDPATAARVMLYRVPFARHMVTHQGTLYGWNGSHYAKVKDAYLDSLLTWWLQDATFAKPMPNGGVTQMRWTPDRDKKRKVVHEMKALTQIDDSTTQGGWIGDSSNLQSGYQANSGSDLDVHALDVSMMSLLPIRRVVHIPCVRVSIGRRNDQNKSNGLKTGSDQQFYTDSPSSYQETSSDWTFLRSEAGNRRLGWYAEPSSPDYFFTYNVDAEVLDEDEPEGWVYELPCPTWHTFLKSTWPDEPESIELLQEVFGYLLSGRTDLQKAFMIVGKPRSGKGTIARVLTELLGTGNVGSPTLRGLADDAQKASLIGKTLAVVGDAGSAGRAAADLAEVLKTVTGEDRVTINRKYMDAWEGKLPTRFLILSNSIPRFADESGAIASRFAILHTTISHAGREDTHLSEKLHSELAGILTWALQGLDRLDARNGRFTEPASSTLARDSLRSMSNAKLLFGAQYIVRDETATVSARDVFDAWKIWCEEYNERPGPASHFGAWLAEEYGVRVIHPRVNGRQVTTYMGIRLSDDAPVKAIDINETNWRA